MLHRLLMTMSTDHACADRSRGGRVRAGWRVSRPERKSSAQRTAQGIAVSRVCASGALVLLAALLGLLCFSAAAFAGTHFAPVAQFGTAGSGSGEFSNPSGVAVQQSTGDLYIADTGNNRVQRFQASGAYLSQFDGTETPAKAFSSPTQLAVDNSTSPFDASTGDVYVVDAGNNNVIDKFTAAGVYIGQITATPHGPLSEPAGVAVDNNGNVWVSQTSGEVAEFANDTSNSFVTSWNTEQGAARGLAVSAAGSEVLVVTGGGAVVRFTTAGSQIGTLDGGSATGVAVDPQSGNSFVDDVGQVNEYDATGATLPPAFGSGTLQSGAGLAFDDADSHLYVADRESNQIQVFGTIKTTDVITEPPTNVTNEGAVLHGTVTPNGLSTTCHFAWEGDPNRSRGETDGWELGGTEGSIPCEPEDVGSGELPIHVQAHFNGKPNRHYHYMLVAENGYGTFEASNETLVTPGPPILIGTVAGSVGPHTATLTAVINPEGQHAVYRFEYGPNVSYGTSIPVPDGDLGSETGNETVSQRLTGLEAGTSYHYRVVATGEHGTATSGDHTLSTLASEIPQADTCSNARLRAQQGAQNLPECRAWEMVSPPDKNGADVMALQGQTRSAADGSAIQYASTGAFGDAHGIGIATDYIARREVGGWVTHGIFPNLTPPPFVISSNQTKPMGDFSADLSTGVLYSVTPQTAAPNVEHVSNLYLRRDLLTPGTGEPLLLSSAFQELPAWTRSQQDMYLVGASSDFHHVVFESPLRLTADAPEGGSLKLYESEDGAVRLVGILPNGEVAPEAHPGGTGVVEGYTRNMVSRDGSRVFFASEGNVYMRVDHSTTVQLNVPENGSEPTPSARLLAATPDGMHVFIASDQPLTSEPVEGEQLYRYDVAALEGHHLTLLSRDEEPSDGISPVLDVIGSSEDGDTVYFRVSGPQKLLKGQPQPIGIENTEDAMIYVYHNGTIGVVGQIGVYTAYALTPEDLSQTIQGTSYRVMPNGELVFQSQAKNTTYDNICTYGRCNGAEGQGFIGCHSSHCVEVYVYNPAVGHTECASCDPSGAAPVGDASGVEYAYTGGATRLTSQHLSNYVSEDGSKIFFDSPDALVPQDTNGQYDVYEYDVSSHQLHLISTGQGKQASYFAEATPSGSDVFFITGQRLVAQDADNEIDLYDARVGGGIAAQNQIVAQGQCSGEACQGALGGVPVFGSPASLASLGAGDVAPVPRAASSSSVKKKVKKKQRKTHCKHKRGRRKARCSTRTVARRAGR